MTKKEMAKAIAEKVGVNQAQVQEIVQSVFDGITETLVKEGRIELRNFSVFEVRKRKPRKARTPPRTGEKLSVPAKLAIMQRGVATDVMTNPKVQQELKDFFLLHGVKQVAMSQGNMGRTRRARTFPTARTAPSAPSGRENRAATERIDRWRRNGPKLQAIRTTLSSSRRSSRK